MFVVFGVLPRYPPKKCPTWLTLCMRTRVASSPLNSTIYTSFMYNRLAIQYPATEQWSHKWAHVFLINDMSSIFAGAVTLENLMPTIEQLENWLSLNRVPSWRTMKEAGPRKTCCKMRFECCQMALQVINGLKVYGGNCQEYQNCDWKSIIQPNRSMTLFHRTMLFTIL